ncbi:TPA: bifunctional glutamate--cysteine ligase GshA/glutathione synthetase GshB [Listeria innocua]|uniref:bifunctional glutamate--cysteine ligase GshA/glutathione synthetase GshB n=1 Tax=Listeria innocua TaxID=1642 RepID=UPI00162945FC|nr:bifunctional glutamate--cysteine ligase GshA/glutathione synthetase GshB [Listeria innocua]MBC1352556.1 bifunctional glutamate--cysteine ligase GshA/glutathione synthetase GshB [Listeria innocua]HBM3441914.1 bifunctional glutamate--cysteine ligase GshA/glutathione synthetase GshB [Listeria innocua]HBM3983463.1 bifunctional glutamate--cysteine ligase GshA/glutathione synthetase GshB [Listeria innocua]HDI0340862.1 bifunctional glutamate--cysteine ligase GshA/glutathione synthetase GshB [Lister
MIKLDMTMLDSFKENEALRKHLFSGHFGLEKENIRVTSDGKLALTPHPAIFGPKEDNPYIKTDFSESQIEMITPVTDSIDAVYEWLENLHNIVSLRSESELLWPSSNPPILPAEEDIPIAEYKTPDSPDRKYREHLAKGYGKKIQLLSGIHYNFSFPEALIDGLYAEISHPNESKRDFKNRLYLKVAKYFMKNRWLLIYLTGASPVYLADFSKTKHEESLPDGSSALRDGISLRNSNAGYKNKEALYVDYNSFDAYISSISNYIEAGKIESMREFYNPIRLKNAHTDQTVESLAEHGVEYLEIRSIDLNPLEPNGISKDELAFIHLFLIKGLLSEDRELCSNNQQLADENENNIALNGLAQPALKNCDNEEISVVEAGLLELNKMSDFIQSLRPEDTKLQVIIEKQKERLLHPEKTIAAQVKQQVTKEGYVDFHLNQAKTYMEETEALAYKLIGAEDMELSTQIIWKDAIARGIKVDVLDRAENFLRFQKGDHVEYVKQASKTSKDNYVSVLMMENKVVTKLVLAEHDIRVPFGDSFSDQALALEAFSLFEDKQIVVKPKSTNYGWGISIFKNKFSLEDYQEALNIAFSYDSSVIIEEFIPGDEFRFLVINDKVEAVLKRVPANVTGDGIHTVRELVEEKNTDPLRGTDHLKPLEKIRTGPEETLMLSMQNLSWDSIPKAEEIIYLRENSNVSTGGDSIDYTEEMDDYFKEIAIRATQVLDAKICGVDIIVPRETIDRDKHAIIELNFNPAMHMHCFPYQGEKKKIGDKILDFLFE